MGRGDGCVEEGARERVRVRSRVAEGSLRDRVGVVLRETLIVAFLAEGSILYFSKTIV